MDRFSRGFTAIVAVAALAAAEAAAYNETEVTDGGTVSGRVLLGDAAVESQTFAITKDTKVCGTGNREFAWVRANGEGLLDAVVYLEGVEAGKPFPKEAMNVAVDQENCAFVPRVQVMANGGRVTPLNSDKVIHNTHAYERMTMADGKIANRTIFNISQLPNDSNVFPKTIKLRRGTSLKIECDAHAFMHAWIFVARNPYFAIVDENGEFAITDVPPGTYVIRSWHGYLGEREATVEVKAGDDASVTFSY